MTKALVDTMEHATPGTIFDGFASYIVRYLAGRVRRQPRRQAPGPDAAAREPLRMFPRDSDAVIDHDPLVAGIAERFSRQLLGGIGGSPGACPSDIPQELAADWRVRKAGFSARAT
jgi:hypothetical protein